LRSARLWIIEQLWRGFMTLKIWNSPSQEKSNLRLCRESNLLIFSIRKFSILCSRQISLFFSLLFEKTKRIFFFNVNFYLLYWISNSFIAFEVLKTAPCALKRFIFVDLRIWNFIILIYFTLLKVSIYLLLFSLNIECLRICW